MFWLGVSPDWESGTKEMRVFPASEGSQSLRVTAVLPG
jgi:hypothetical protein